MLRAYPDNGNPVTLPTPLANAGVLTVSQAAKMLGVSESWIRRHKRELPLANLPGRMVRFDVHLLRSVRGHVCESMRWRRLRKLLRGAGKSAPAAFN
jgi:hypothetical protein